MELFGVSNPSSGVWWWHLDCLPKNYEAVDAFPLYVKEVKSMEMQN